MPFKIPTPDNTTFSSEVENAILAAFSEKRWSLHQVVGKSLEDIAGKPPTQTLSLSQAYLVLPEGRGRAAIHQGAVLQPPSFSIPDNRTIVIYQGPGSPPTYQPLKKGDALDFSFVTPQEKMAMISSGTQSFVFGYRELRELLPQLESSPRPRH